MRCQGGLRAGSVDAAGASVSPASPASPAEPDVHSRPVLRRLLPAAPLLGLLAVAPGCPSPPPAPTPTPVAGLSVAQQAEAQALGGRFAGSCDIAALARLRALRAEFGAPSPLREALLAAFDSCSAPVALAELLAETLPDEATALEKQQLGAAWIRAARYHEAAAVMLPLADSDSDPQNAWLAGFALYHSGRDQQALPYLRRGRSRGAKADAALLIGLSLLRGGDVPGSLAELEAAAAESPDNASLHHALAQAYAAAGRDEDAAAAARKVGEAHRAAALLERTQTKLAALGNALNAAWANGDLVEAERIVDQMWADAPPPLRKQLLGFRAEIYKRTDRPADEAGARAALESSP